MKTLYCSYSVNLMPLMSRTCCDNQHNLFYLWRSFPFFNHTPYVMLTLPLPKGNNIHFLLTTFIHNKENKKLLQLIKWSPKENALMFYQILSNYRKIPKISPGAYIFQRPFLRGLFLEGLVFGRASLRREICVSKSIGLAI